MKDVQTRSPIACHPIFQRITAAGNGGIATLILDGENLLPLLLPHLRSRRKIVSAQPGNLFFARIVDAHGAIVDEVVLAPTLASASETRNPQFELSCHGGVGAIAAIEERLEQAGFARARPTELLERAHLNSNLSLLTIEARLRLNAAATARQADVLLHHTELQKRWEQLGFEMTLGMRNKEVNWREKLSFAAREDIQHGETALRVLAQHSAVIAGPVNAGKSTLANLLARAERHIVSEIPGTTRDKLDTSLSLRGLNLLLSDTAGLRESSDAIENEGQRRANSAAATADIRIILLDGSCAPGDAEIEMILRFAQHGPSVLVLNKTDLGIDENAAGVGFLIGATPVPISARTGLGLEQLEIAIEQLCLRGSSAHFPAPFTHRQLEHLRELQSGLLEGIEGTELLATVRKLIGTRPNPDELKHVLAEAGSR